MLWEENLTVLFTMKSMPTSRQSAKNARQEVACISPMAVGNVYEAYAAQFHVPCCTWSNLRELCAGLGSAAAAGVWALFVV